MILRRRKLINVSIVQIEIPSEYSDTDLETLLDQPWWYKNELRICNMIPDAPGSRPYILMEWEVDGSYQHAHTPDYAPDYIGVYVITDGVELWRYACVRYGGNLEVDVEYDDNYGTKEQLRTRINRWLRKTGI